MFSQDQLAKLLLEGKQEALRLEAEMDADAEKARQAALVLWLEAQEKGRALRRRSYAVQKV